MATMNVSLPEEMKSWIETRTRRGPYANASDYVRDLIRRDQQRSAILADLKKLVEEGIASGPGRFESIDAIKAEARRHAEQQRPA